MGTVFHVLKEEYDRLVEADLMYSSKIELLPRGKPRIKRIKNAEYLYLNRREGGKIVDEYVGRVDSAKALEIRALVEKRDQLSEQQKQVRERLTELAKVLRGKI